ncbi:MAG: nucleotidyltransferase domain-containing protein [Candidatus Colwellbacteria bacterium]|jgi:predicted nucleotidyltransferase|nr:nucleotidyltransferase domain-containing protein [Candidatus Colwellbacteria bacterium]
MLSSAKERIIKKRVSLFSWVPFVKLAVLSGSCAMGSAGENSDIDIIIGTEKGRTYLCRAFTLIFLDFLRVRNKSDNKENSPCQSAKADKLCLSHFLSVSSLKMSEPENLYESELYTKIVPVYGSPAMCASFIKDNIGIIGKILEYRSSCLYVGSEKKWLARIIEKTLSGKLGNWLEKKARSIQSKKICNYASYLAADGRKMRVITSEDRVETCYKIN